MTACHSALMVAIAGLAWGCSKDAPPPPATPSPTAPWPASAPPASKRPLVARYELVPQGEVLLRLGGKRDELTGRARVVRGWLELDLGDLSKTRAMVEVDLSSMEVRATDQDAGLDYQLSASAHDWLEIGASLPETTREANRWASFRCLRVQDVSHLSAYDGERKGEPIADAGVDGSSGRADAAPAEQRVVSLTAIGQLEVHHYRVEWSIPLRLAFHYSGPADDTTVPPWVTIETARAGRVSRRAHDIRARDARGRDAADAGASSRFPTSDTVRVEARLTARMSASKG